MKKLDRSFDAVFQAVDAICAPLKKIEQARKLFDEARAEIAALLGTKPARRLMKRKAPMKRKGKNIEISYKAPVVEIGGDAETVVKRIFKGSMKFGDIKTKAKMSGHRVRAVLHEMRAQDLATQNGKGRNSVWVRR